MRVYRFLTGIMLTIAVISNSFANNHQHYAVSIYFQQTAHVKSDTIKQHSQLSAISKFFKI